MKKYFTRAALRVFLTLRKVLVACSFFSLGILAIAEPSEAETVTYYYTNQQGTPLATADATGNVVSATDYHPYGAQALGTAVAGPGYIGHVNDPDLGFVYMQARYYDPIGRLLSVDPVRPVAGELYMFNRFAYAKNNPVGNVDKNGKSVTCADNSCTIQSHSIAEAIIDHETVAVIYTEILVINALRDSGVLQNSNSESPALPKDLVGTSDDKSRQQGGRVVSGPLSPANGGTGDSVKDFDALTGGKSSPAPEEKGYPEGTMVGTNGISLRPGTSEAGPRIDVPANGDKPHETLHYPNKEL